MQVQYWYPELSEPPDKPIIKTNSWFDMNTYSNPNPNVVKTRKRDLTGVVNSCLKVRLFPTEIQKKKLQMWFGKFIDMYNCSNEFLRKKTIKEYEKDKPDVPSLTLDFDKLDILELDDWKKNIKNEKKDRTAYKKIKLYEFYNDVREGKTKKKKSDIIKNYQKVYKDHMIKLNDNFKQYLNMSNLRDNHLHVKKAELAKCNINKHILDQAIAHNVARYKSAITNFKRGHIDTFRMRNLKHTKRRKILLLEANLFSKISINETEYDTSDKNNDKSNIKKIIQEEYLKVKNFSDKDIPKINSRIIKLVQHIRLESIFIFKKKKSRIQQLKGFINREFKKLMKKDKNEYQIGICPREIGNVKCSSDIKDIPKITKTCTLQYDRLRSTYTLIIPRTETVGEIINRRVLRNKKDMTRRKVGKAGGDPGERTFVTVYSKNKVYDICNNVRGKLKKYYEDIDKMTYNFKRFKMRRGDYYRRRNRIEKKVENIIDDMHWKTAKFLCDEFDVIQLGKINTGSIISRDTSNINSITKRSLLSLSHSRFRGRLKHQASKYDCELKLINEYKTTMTCHKCSRIKVVGASKEYKCVCGVKVGRDVNAAINIYKKTEYIIEAEESDSDDDEAEK
jgi:transposase